MGQPIINHQGVAFMLADMAIGVEAARGLVWKAAWAKDCMQRNSTSSFIFTGAQAVHVFQLNILAFYASMAKAFAGKTAVENANLGVQGNSIDFVASSSGVYLS